MTLIQIILVIFLFFAVSRVVLRFRGGQISPFEFLFWSVVFLAAITGIAFPQGTTDLARLVGIGRGADLVIYISIVVLFYLVFRIYVLLEDVRHEITELIRAMALQNTGKKRK